MVPKSVPPKDRGHRYARNGENDKVAAKPDLDKAARMAGERGNAAGEKGAFAAGRIARRGGRRPGAAFGRGRQADVSLCGRPYGVTSP